MWTIEKVKDKLPDVKCKFGVKVFDCRISGRENQFATIWAIKAHYLQAEFAWETIVDCLNNNRILLGS